MDQVQTEDQIAEAVRGANGPLFIRGGGTRTVGHPVAGEVLDVSRLSGITLYEPGALTLVAQAGTPVAEIEAALAAENQRLAFEPSDMCTLLGTDGQTTIGGVVATNASGPRRIVAGAARDFALGVRFVDGAGQVVKNGGRVMKNVTGYDLVKLMCGSWGTLGVLTEVSLKVLPRAEMEATLVLHGLDPDAAVRAMAAALGSPYDVSGAAHYPQSAGDDPSTMIRLEGFEGSVRYRMEALKTRLQAFGDISDVEGDASAAAWARTRDVHMLADAAGDIWRVSVKPSDGPEVLARAGTEQAVMDWAGGLVWLCVPAGTDLRERLAGLPGHATLMRADAGTRARLGMFHPEPAPVARLSADLRARFDPRGILNPGLMAA